MQHYERYKASGVEWLGEIPAHWDVRPGFTCFKENKDRNKGLVENTVLSLSYGRIVIKPEEKLTGLVPESFEGYQLIKPGDIVIRTTDLQNDQTSLRVGYAKDKGMITSAYLGLRCHPEINPEYVFRLLESYDALKVFYGMGSGLRQNIDFWDFKRLPVPLPPREEQDRIVAFLDQKTAEIDAAIAKKERLIELLKEQRSTSLEKAVTEGLEAIKNSESGFTPKHWSRVKLKYCIHLLPGFAFKSSAYSSDDSDIPLLRGVNVNPGKLNWEDKVSWPKASLATHLRYMLKPGDLVIGMDRPWVADGIRVAPVTACDVPCLLLQRVARLRAAKGITQEFLALVLTSREFLSYFEPMLTGISVPHISPEQIGNYEAVLPPVEEQRAICEFVSQLSRSFEQALGKETQIVNGLRQLKTSVIADVVLGKVKV